MHLYNTFTRTVEPFIPVGDEVTIYVCGITPYDTTHLGHAFTYSVFDVLIRYLEYQGQSVHYAQNVTDIDDDILRKSRSVGEDWLALGNRWTTQFLEDLRTLNLRPPDFYPRATETIPGIVTAVEQLLRVGVAYESAGSVYFHIDAWAPFGRLSHIPRADMLAVANQRGNLADDPNKRDPLDFILWQAQKPGEPAWESPWGPGRPGWHIECSTMSTELLGPTIDIHGGGGDLVFPHHECEIAQVEPVTGDTFVRFWMHAAMVYHEGEKMSKSLGNLIMARDLLRTYSADALRHYLASHHYRVSWSYEAAELDASAEAAQHLLAAANVGGGEVRPFNAAPGKSVVLEALADDLDTPTALAALDQIADDILAAAEQGREVSAAQATLRELAGLFGIRLDAPYDDRITAGWDAHLQRFTA